MPGTSFYNVGRRIGINLKRANRFITGLQEGLGTPSDDEIPIGPSGPMNNVMSLSDVNTAISNERALTTCLPLENYVQKRGLRKICKLLQKKKEARALRALSKYALPVSFPFSPEKHQLCLDIIRVGIIIYCKAGPGGLAAGTLNIVCAQYL